MGSPLVSVVIPAYNAHETVGDAVCSALTQTVSDLEIIVVDDGSSDATRDVVAGIDDPRLRLIRQANGGAAAARNAGILDARGRYVALLDADDLWLSHKLERQLAVLESGDVGAVQSGAFFVDATLRTLSRWPCKPSRDALLETLRFQNMPNNMSSLVLERERLLALGAFDASLVILEEWDMQVKAARFLNLQSVEEPLTLYRVHPGNRSLDLDIHIEPGYRVLDRLFADPELPPHIHKRRTEIYARFFTMLAGGALRSGRRGDAVRWGLKAIGTHPAALRYILALPMRRLTRQRSRGAGPAAFAVVDGRVVAA